MHIKIPTNISIQIIAIKKSKDLPKRNTIPNIKKIIEKTIPRHTPKPIDVTELNNPNKYP